MESHREEKYKENMSRNSLQNYIGFLKHKSLTAETWSAGNTHTVTDPDVKENSFILVMPTAAVAGRWYVTVSNGSFLITSSDVEAAGATFHYLIF